MSGGRRSVPFRRKVHNVLEGVAEGGPLARFVHVVLVLLVCISVGAVVLESVPSLEKRFGALFMGIEVTAALVFTVEYVTRLWAAVEHQPLRRLPPWRARLVYALYPASVIDILAVLPVLLAFLLPSELQVLLLLRLLRFFKLARYSPGMRSLGEAVYEERRALLACLVIILGLMIVAAAAMHMVEGPVQPDRFGSIPESMWWAIVTLTTVGYGDAVPVTVGGKLVAAATAVAGLVMLALPIGIIATTFAEVIRRRDFVVTWSMVAKVPLFSELDAAEIGDILKVMHSRMVEAGETVVRRGEKATAMYFVAAGQLEVIAPGKRALLHEGEFFGESALIPNAERQATVRSLTKSRLLVLDVSDLHGLLERDAEIRARIDMAMLERGMLASGKPDAPGETGGMERRPAT
jgi:voltage-gated potassium channel